LVLGGKPLRRAFERVFGYLLPERPLRVNYRVRESEAGGGAREGTPPSRSACLPSVCSDTRSIYCCKQPMPRPSTAPASQLADRGFGRTPLRPPFVLQPPYAPLARRRVESRADPGLILYASPMRTLHASPHHARAGRLCTLPQVANSIEQSKRCTSWLSCSPSSLLYR
jgi:hypothetical protein